MRFLTPIDRLIHVGGTGITVVVWLLAIAAVISYPFAAVPESVSLAIAWTAGTVCWMRFRNVTVAGLLRRILFTRARR